MTTLRQAAQAALEALKHCVREAQENLVPTIQYGPVADAMNALRAALADQPKPVRLTDEQVREAVRSAGTEEFGWALRVARAVEAAVLKANGLGGRDE